MDIRILNQIDYWWLVMELGGNAHVIGDVIRQMCVFYHGDVMSVFSMDGADLCFEIVRRASAGFVYSEAVARYTYFFLLFYSGAPPSYFRDFPSLRLNEAVGDRNYVSSSYSQWALSVAKTCVFEPSALAIKITHYPFCWVLCSLLEIRKAIWFVASLSNFELQRLISKVLFLKSECLDSD